MSFNKKKHRIRNLFIVITIFIIVLTIFQVSKDQNVQTQYVLTKMREFNQVLSFNEEIAEGTTYYVSSTGTSTEGTDINNPMSLETANNKKYQLNDKILLKKGDIFYGQIRFVVAQNGEGMCYVGNYGEGELPRVRGCKILDKSTAWNLVDETNNIYSIDLTNTDNFSGIKNVDVDSCNIGCLIDKNGRKYANIKENKESLTNEYDFFCDNSNLYIKCNGNPTEKMGELIATTRIDLCKMSSNMIVTGIQFEYTGAHAIVKRMYPIENVYIHDCIIENIGGSVQERDPFTRYGNGIEFWEDAKNILIEKNIIRNVFDAAITLQGTAAEWENVEIQENYLINNCYSFEIWSSGEAKGMKNINIHNNKIINQGRGWGQEFRNNPQVSANVVIYGYVAEYGDINIYENYVYNPQRLFFIPYFVSKDAIVKYYHIDNNKIYYSTDTFYVNNDLEKDMNYYNLEKDSYFRGLEENETEKISNTEILGSYDYDQIKIYYENLENEFEYTDKLKPIIEQYTNFEEKYVKEMENFNEIQQGINNIKQNMKNTTASTDVKYIIQQLEQTYKIGIQIINTNVDNTEDMLIAIEEIGRTYKDIIDLKNEHIEVDLGNIENQIELLTEQLNSNSDLDIQKLLELKESALKYYNKILDTQDYVSQYNYISSKYLIEYINILLNNKITEYIENNPVTVTYSDMSEWTNKDVIATLNIGSDAKVTNNEGNNTYTFKENGSFSFEYERRGRTFSQEVKVENIDKILPEISNIENGKIYFESVIPNVNDEHLGKVQVTLNGQAIEGYSLGNELTQEGQYEVMATDKAGNVTKVVFYIFLNDENGYQIKDNNIMNIYPETTVKEFKEAFTLLKEYVIKNADKELTEEDNIATGDVLEDDEGKIFTLIVLGDLNQDGKLSLSDISLERKYILKMIDLSEIQKLATDVNFDNNISLTDISIMRKLVLEMK